MDVREEGSETDCSETHSEKANWPILVTVPGRLTERSVSFCSKALFPMAVTASPLIEAGTERTLSEPL